MKDNSQALKIVLVIAVSAALLWVFLARDNSDIGICRFAFGGLVKGNISAQGSIDWDRLKALDADVGAYFSKLPNEKEKASYKAAFIKSFANGFKNSGGNLGEFADWRVESEAGAKITVVATDYRGKTLLFSLLKQGGRRIIAIQWK